MATAVMEYVGSNFNDAVLQPLKNEAKPARENRGNVSIT